MGRGLPQADYNPDLQDDPQNELAQGADIDDTFWRFMLLFPVLINVFMLMSFLLFVN